MQDSARFLYGTVVPRVPAFLFLRHPHPYFLRSSKAAFLSRRYRQYASDCPFQLVIQKHGRFGKAQATALRDLAARSVGSAGKALCIPVSQCIATIEHYDAQIAELDDAITQIMQRLDSVIMTIPGIGSINGAIILGEIGDIHRFGTPHKLLAYAGLDPPVNQSGNFNAKRTKMSKRGSKVLRHGLMNAAFNVVQNTVTFRHYYDAKRAQGRLHYNALGHVAGKLVRSIFKMLSENIPFALE